MDQIARLARVTVYDMFIHQILAMFYLMNGNSIFLIAPTNSGKTWVAILALYIGTNHGRISVYLAPTTTLVDEKEEEFERLIGHKVKILKITGESRPNLAELRPKIKKGNKIPKERDQRILLICTYESFRSFLFQLDKYEFFNRKDIFGAIIVDEIHMINDPSRGMKLETMIYKLKFEYFDDRRNKPLFCFLSATINRESAEYWSERFGAKLLYYPTNRKFKFEVHEKQFRKRFLNQIKNLVEDFLVKNRQKNPNAKMLIFIKSREKAQKIADHLKEELARFRDIFGFIHAGLSATEKKEIFDAFNSGRIRIISCSPILEAGIDVKDVEQIIITDPERYSRIELEQIIGRCRELIGTIIHLFLYKEYRNFKKYVKFLDKNQETFQGYELEEIKSQITLQDLPQLILEYIFLREPSKDQIREHFEQILHIDKYEEYFIQLPFVLSLISWRPVKPLEEILNSLYPY